MIKTFGLMALAVLVFSGSTLVGGAAYAQTQNEDQKIVASDAAYGDQFGESVSIDGTRAIVGAPIKTVNGERRSGNAYVYELENGAWVEKAKLKNRDIGTDDRFGFAVSVSGDRVIVGANNSSGDGSFESYYSGSAYVFDLVDGEWMEKARLTASEIVRYATFGSSVSMSGDRVLVGAPRDNGGEVASSGSAYVFELVGGEWVQTAKLTAPIPQAYAYFGHSVSLLGDRAIVGSNREDHDGESDRGSAYVFDLVGGEWVQTARLTASTPIEYAWFGVSVSQSENRAVIGTSRYKDTTVSYPPVTGSAYIFDLVGSGWVETANLISSDAANTDNFGVSVSLSGDRILVGAYAKRGVSGRTGRAYIYERTTTGCWAETAKLNASDEATAGYNRFGESVSLSGDRAIVGAFGNSTDATVAGSAYAFTISSSSGGSDYVICDLSDTTPPVVTLNGTAELTLECGIDAYNEEGATAEDDQDGTVMVSISGSVDAGTVGDYTVTYTATDDAGNEGSKERIVHVVDRTPPVITILGDNPTTVICGIEYADAGATATDICDGDLTSQIKVGNSIDINVPGIYEVAYKVKDSAGNFSEVVTRTVEVINPVPELIAIDDQSVNEGETLDVAISATIQGNKPLALSVSALAFGTLTDKGDGTGMFALAPDFDAAGTYEITVTATNTTGEDLTASETFTLTVVNVNRAPSLAGPAGKPGDQSVDEGQTVLIHLIASDPDGNVPTLTTENLPAFATFTDDEDGTASLSFSPDFTQAGMYADITVIASDGALTDAVVFALQVNDVNRAPVAVSQNVVLNLAANGGATLLASAVNNGSSDPDGDEITLSVDKTAFTCEDLGDVTVTLTVSDGELSATATAVVTVKDVTPPNIVSLTINTVETSGDQASATFECTNPDGEEVALSVLASDVCSGSDLTILWKDLGAGVLGEVASITHTLSGLSTHIIEVTVSDKADPPNSTTGLVTIALEDTTPPEVTASLDPTRKPSKKKDDDDDDDDDDDNDDDNDDDEGSNGYWYQVVAQAGDICDENPAVTSFITQPLTFADVYEVKYKKYKKNKIEIKIEDKKIKVSLKGPSENEVRGLFDQAIAQGGFDVVDGQVLVVKSKDPKKNKGVDDDDDDNADDDDDDGGDDDDDDDDDGKKKKKEEESDDDKGSKRGKNSRSSKAAKDPRKGHYKYEFDGLTLIKADGIALALVVSAEDGSGNVSEPVTATPPKRRRAKPVLTKPVVSDDSDAGDGGLVFGASNYPNPFNPETVIQYALPEAGDVRLVVYNMLGQQVRELVNASQSPGQYHVRWDSRDALGRSVSSGVYFYRLVAGSNVTIKRMLLLK